MKSAVSQAWHKIIDWFTWQYPVKLDHVYYSLDSKAYITAFKLKFSRITLKMRLNEIVSNNSILKQLNPCDSYIIGKLLCCQRDKVFDPAVYSCNNYNTIVPEVLLYITNIDTRNRQITLRHVHSQAAKTIPLAKFEDNLFLLSSLPNDDAFDLGSRFSCPSNQ